MDSSSLNSYIDYLRIEKGAAANTVAAYRRDLNRYLVWRSSNESSSLKEYAETLIELAPASLERNFSAIRSFHNYLQREFGIKDLSDELPEIARRSRLPKALTVEEITLMIDSAKTPSKPISLRDHLLLELLYSTGGRVSEIVGIDLNDIAINEINGEPKSITVLKLKGKGGKERIVPLGTFAKNALEDYLVRTRPNLIRNGAESALFLNSNGKRLSRVSAWDIVKKAASKAGISAKVTPHIFRHSFATHLLDGGADIRVVQELLGHSSVTTTQIYTLITIDKVRESYRLAHPRA
jgi:integrase/recombinase XerD